MATVQAPPQAAGPHPARIVTLRPLVIIGGGEHARVVADAARTRPDAWQLIGFTAASATEDQPNHPAPDLPNLGNDASLASRIAAQPEADRPWLVLGFGASAANRRRAAKRFGHLASWASVIHVTAWVSPSAVVEPGAVVLAGAIVNAGARVGAHTIVNSRAVIEHDVLVGELCHVGPGAVIGGGTRIGAGSSIGLGASVRDHVIIGDGVTVGMGAAVLGDVAAGLTVMGVPARPRAVVSRA